MKKAVILSGELRSYKKCYNNFKNIFINDKSTDIFISVWKQVGRNKKYKNKNVRKHDRIIDDVDNENHIVTKEELINMYKPKSIYLEDYKDEYKNELNNIKRPDDFFLNKKKELTTITNLPMFYMMKKGLDLKNDYEIKNNFKYDIVIRIRPDINPFPINWNKFKKYIENDILITFPICYPRNLSDKFAFGSSKIMDFYLNVWDYLEQYWYPEKFKNPKKIYEFVDNKKLLEIHRRHCEQLFYYRMITDNKEWVEVNNHEDFANEKKLKKIKNH